MKRNERGITLIALVVTIVVLLILAGVSISMLTGENGIITQAQKAKEETVIGREKEAISIAYTACVGKNMMENVTSGQLQEELNNNGENTTVRASGNNLIVTFNETQHRYQINQDGDITELPVIDSSATNKIVDVIYLDSEIGEGAVVTADGYAKKVIGIERGIMNQINMENSVNISENIVTKSGEGWFIDNQGKFYVHYVYDGEFICLNDLEGSILNGKNIVNAFDSGFMIDDEGSIYNFDGSKITFGSALKGKTIVDIKYYSEYSEDKNINTYIILDNQGKVYTLGKNSEGRLGTGDSTDFYTEEAICISDILGNKLNGVSISKICFDGKTVIALDTEGKVYMWGIIFGSETYESSNVPICISEIEEYKLNGKNIKEIQINENIIIALDTEGKVYTWGDNRYGELGDGTGGEYGNYSNEPICISDIQGSILNEKNIVQINICINTVTAIDEQGNVYGWGINENGQLGYEYSGIINTPICISENEMNKIYNKKIVNIDSEKTGTYSGNIVYITDTYEVFYTSWIVIH